jgi:predicted enzyme related to lactoylglutathione lyase
MLGANQLWCRRPTASYLVRESKEMQMQGLIWLGVRTHNFEQMVRLYRDVFGLRTFHEDASSVRFRLTDGTEVHVYGPADEEHRFFGTGAVVGILVDEADVARAEMQAAGIEFIGPSQHDGSTSWSHFRGPDGNVYEIMSRR